MSRLAAPLGELSSHDYAVPADPLGIRQKLEGREEKKKGPEEEFKALFRLC